MNKYDFVKNNLVLTYHGKDNYYGSRNDGADRTDITRHDIVCAICYGVYGYAGKKRFKVTHKGLEVIYKRNGDEYVVITYYRKNRNEKKKRLYKLFDQIKSS